MIKSEIRKKMLKIRKQYMTKNPEINFKYILNILNKHKKISKIVGGYYPYNYEIDTIKILKKRKLRIGW